MHEAIMLCCRDYSKTRAAKLRVFGWDVEHTEIATRLVVVNEPGGEDTTDNFRWQAMLA